MAQHTFNEKLAAFTEILGEYLDPKMIDNDPANILTGIVESLIEAGLDEEPALAELVDLVYPRKEGE